VSASLGEYLKEGEGLAIAVILKESIKCLSSSYTVGTFRVCVLSDFIMQQIYTQSHEEFEVFTTVLSPQG